MTLTLNLDGAAVDVDIVGRRPALRCRVGGTVHEVRETAAGDDCFLLTVDGREYTVWRTHEGERVHLRVGTRTFSVGVTDPLDSTRHGASGDELRADMPGVVVTLRCTAGDAVAAGDALLTIESMKMQITLHAPRDGVIAEVHVAANQPFQKGALLVALEKHAGESA